ncbi:hypothetical protein ACE02P_15030 [Shewanella bicestrii]|jgi:hypothetical protein|uniref:hypothetical protein n=1 Tax=Shewanella xiamenensis TaxID=332186 RepID=UPI001C4E1116|nr:hypothetical protein [Shewanella xiamenensis]MBW0298719.1 hypothetical protein [Shewanella xiamenensis]MCT8869002.1 hypothetical protein [Shewanella xiamenensis]MCT8873687.1 hypothetical protein [Shewanella xiamenensis]UWH39845.1 hypothetical protein KXJ80_00630 [Shewanella xiamenensis]
MNKGEEMDVTVVEDPSLISTNSYQKVLQIYFVNLSAFRRFVGATRTQKELKHKIKEYLSRCNNLYVLNRSPIQLQVDKLVLLQLALTLNDDLAV